MCVPLLASGSEPSRATGTIFIFREAAYRKVLRVSRSVMRKYYACVLTVFTAVLGARVGGLYSFRCITAGSYTSCSVGLLLLANNALHCTSKFMYSPNKCTVQCAIVYSTNTHTHSGFLFKKCLYRVVDVSSILTH